METINVALERMVLVVSNIEYWLCFEIEPKLKCLSVSAVKHSISISLNFKTMNEQKKLNIIEIWRCYSKKFTLQSNDLEVIQSQRIVQLPLQNIPERYELQYKISITVRSLIITTPKEKIKKTKKISR